MTEEAGSARHRRYQAARRHWLLLRRRQRARSCARGRRRCSGGFRAWRAGDADARQERRHQGRRCWCCMAPPIRFRRKLIATCLRPRWMRPARAGMRFISATWFTAYTFPDANMPPVAKYDEPATRHGYTLAHAFIEDAFAGKLCKERRRVIRTVTGDVEKISRADSSARASADRSLGAEGAGKQDRRR